MDPVPHAGSIHHGDLLGPPEMDLEIVWQEHELGQYPVIVLVWEDRLRGVPWNYISRCEAALAAFENGAELPPGWTMPPVRPEDELNEPFDPDKPPPEPPDILDVFENQRYISKLIQWSLEASKHERSRPHLVAISSSLAYKRHSQICSLTTPARGLLSYRPPFIRESLNICQCKNALVMAPTASGRKHL
jgi:hypothetical protein